MRGRIRGCETAMPPARAGGIAENRKIASGDLCCEMGCPPARAGGVSF
jgi:hypothetical protein